MTDVVDAGNVRARLEVTTEDWKAGLKEAKESLATFKQQAGDTLTQFGKTLGEAFALNKIKDFVVEAVQEYAAHERALNSLGHVIQGVGGNWNALRSQVEEYVNTTKMATRFSETEVEASLQSLTLRTRDYTTAVQLNERAMNLAVAGNMSLEEAANIVGLAYVGNTRGISQLARSLGVAGEKAKDAKGLFELLDKQFANMSRSEKDTEMQLHQLAVTWEDFKLEVGKAFAFVAPIIKDFFNSIRLVSTNTFLLIGTVGLTIIDVLKDVVRQAETTATFLTNVWRHPLDAVKQLIVDTGKNIKDTGKEIGQDWKAYAQQMSEEFDKLFGGKDGKTTPLKKIIPQIKDDLKDLGSMFDMFVEGIKNKEVTLLDVFSGISKKHILINRANYASDEAYAEAIKKKSEEMKKTAEAMAQEVEKLGKSISDGIGSDMETFVTNLKNGTAQAKDAFGELGKSILKSLLNALGDSLIQLGSSYIIKALAALATGVEAAAAPGYFAAGSISSAGGGGIKAIAGGLAGGGIMMQPGYVSFAEHEPEMAIPLSRINETPFGGGGGIHVGQVVITNHGVKGAEEISGSRMRQSISRTLLDTNDEMLRRRGKRFNQ